MLTRASARFLTTLTTSNLNVVNNVAKQQFEVSYSDSIAYLRYTEIGDEITLVRTEVPPPLQGKGVGKHLAKAALEYAHNNKRSVIIECHFISKYYTDNKQKYRDLKVTQLP